MAFEPLQNLIPGFPAPFIHTYDLGTDGPVAGQLHTIFEDHFNPVLFKLVDIFTWPSIIESIPKDLLIGQGSVSPAVDVSLFGGTFHNHDRVLSLDRVDVIDGLHQAYVTVQVPGNYFESFGIDTNYQLTVHVPLEGPAMGLAYRGDFQETLFSGGVTAHP